MSNLMLVVGNIFIKGIFLLAATYLLVNNHPVAGAWCIVGALLCGFSKEKDDE